MDPGSEPASQKHNASSASYQRRSVARRILVPLDRSDHSTDALEHALEVHAGSEFVLLHVIDPNRWTSADEEGELVFSADSERAAKRAGAELLTSAATRVEEAGETAERVTRVGSPARAILSHIDEAEPRIDQVVMGSRGRTGLGRILMGSVAERVARRSSVPVTIVH